MLSLEIIMIITNICISTGKLDKDTQNSIKCNESIIKCMEIEVKTLGINQALTQCIVRYEVSK